MILRAKKSHMPSGYAAVGEVLKPPSAFLPIMAWRWLWPQSCGSGPKYQPRESKRGQPTFPNSPIAMMSESSRVGFLRSTPGNWH